MASYKTRQVYTEGDFQQNKSVTVTSIPQTFEADAPEYIPAMKKLTVNSVSASVDENIVASNIRNGVKVLGVAGNYSNPFVTSSAFDSLSAEGGWRGRCCVENEGAILHFTGETASSRYWQTFEPDAYYIIEYEE